MLTDPLAFLYLSSISHWSSNSSKIIPPYFQTLCVFIPARVWRQRQADLRERRKDSYDIETVMEVRLTVDQQPLSGEGGFQGRVGNEAWGAGVGQSVKESLLEKRWKGELTLLWVTGKSQMCGTSWLWQCFLDDGHSDCMELICIHLMAIFSGIYCHLYFFWDLSTHLSIYWLDYLFLWSSLISALCVFLAFSVYRNRGTAGRSPPLSRTLTFAGQGFAAPCSCIVIHACSLSW